MPLGNDRQYDLSWAEQDKIRRRLELKQRLKEEGIRKRYDPFLQMKKEIFTDPAVDRYMDFRKTGRMPNTPFKPKLFFTMLGILVVPIWGLKMLIDWERAPYLAGCASGDIPYEDRPLKVVAG